MNSDLVALLGLDRADTALRVVASLVAVGQFVTGAQLIASRRLFDDGELLAWPAVRQLYESSRFAAIAALPFGAPVVRAVALLKSSSAVALVGCALWSQPMLYALVVLIIANVALIIRIPHGRTGADDMGNVILVALLLGAFVDTRLTQTACLAFTAAAAATAYATAGLSKVPVAGWRDGSLLRQVVSTDQYGNARAARYLTRSRTLAKALSAAVITYECLFPLILVIPQEWAIAGLIVGVLFHVGAAFIMGLNTFVWTFAATYPAVLFVNSHVHVW